MSSTPALFLATGDGLRVAVKVTPKASHDRIGDVFIDADGRNVLKILVTAAPDRGKANDAVIRLLAKAWAVPKTTIQVTAGATDRRKTLLVTGDASGLQSKLQIWLEKHNG